MNHRPLSVLALVLACSSVLACSAEAPAATSEAALTQAEPMAAKLASIAGTYEGEWTLFGVDAEGAARVVAHWADTVTLSFEPTVEPDRAYLTVHDTLTFGADAPPRTMTFKEGFLVGEGGTVGDRFFEIPGSPPVVEKEIAPGVYTFAQDEAGPDLASLGFTNAQTGRHVTVKVVSRDGDIEIEDISRVTTVRWRDASGTDRTTQMVTMKGFHRRSLAAAAP